jgi:hypothetical protein
MTYTYRTRYRSRIGPAGAEVQLTEAAAIHLTNELPDLLELVGPAAEPAAVPVVLEEGAEKARGAKARPAPESPA